ncbi:Rha family transcriptional regulator [Bartonella sp. CL434QHHD]|uniref:Rha family transcriptional regulator n=1 Tax=Bartonella sp. CL434QHHD TaxID=3243529 RepID=UPI003857C917
MSSREIAELCSKRHDHVMRDIKKMLEELNAPKFGVVDFSGYYLDSKGESRPCYNLLKRECLILVSGYSTALRAKRSCYFRISTQSKGFGWFKTL